MQQQEGCYNLFTTSQKTIVTTLKVIDYLGNVGIAGVQ